MFKKHGLKKTILIILCVMLAGPQVGLGLELVALVEVSGAELFIFYFTAPFWFYWYKFKTWYLKNDPYFFIPCRAHLMQCPALIAHMIPFLMVATIGTMSTVAVTT